MSDPRPVPTGQPPSAFGRHLVVTAVATPANLFAYIALARTTSWPAVWCNLVAAAVLTGPTFVVSRRWVWASIGNVAAQASAFWSTTLVNVLLASAVVWWCEASGMSEQALSFVPLVSYAVLWLARFFVLDRLVFRSRASVSATGAGP